MSLLKKGCAETQRRRVTSVKKLGIVFVYNPRSTDFDRGLFYE